MTAQPSWFSRNWKWLLPAGCLMPLLCCLSFVGTIYFGVSKAIEASRPFAMAMEKARSDAQVAHALGSPLETRIGVRGSMTETSGTGHADFTVPIAGPQGRGDLHVVAHAAGDAWALSTAEVVTPQATIDLLKTE